MATVSPEVKILSVPEPLVVAATFRFSLHLEKSGSHDDLVVWHELKPPNSE